MTDKKYTPYITVKEKTDTQPAEFVELCTSPCDSGAEVSVSNAPTTPIPISGSLTVTAGSINMTLGAELNALSAFSQNGIMVRTGTGSYAGRTLTAGTGISISNGNGVSGNPTVTLGTIPINKLASYPNNSSFVLKGNGTWGSINSFSSPIDMNSNRINNLADPFSLNDAVNLNYLLNSYTANFTSNSSTYNIPITNSNSYATENGFEFIGALNESGLKIGLNNSNMRGYIKHPLNFGNIDLIIGTATIASINNGGIDFGNNIISFNPNSGYYYIPINNSNSSATETGFDIKNNGVSGLKIGHSNSSSWSYLKSRSTIEYYVQSAGSYHLSMKMWATGISLDNNRIFDLADPVNSTDAATKNYVDNAVSSGGSSSNPLDSTEVNVNGVYTNWLKRGGHTKTGVAIYGQNVGSFILEHKSVESCGLAVNGDSDGCTIWSPGDSDAYLNIQDEDSSNSRKAYVNRSGSWVSVSSKERKYSIRDKSNNNILNRFMDVKVKTYGHKYDEGKFNKKKTERIARKSKKMATGLILEDLFDIFPNCISDYKNELFQKKDKNKKLSLEKEVKDIKNAGIDYNVLMCYFIMAFQEFVEKTNNRIKQLEAKND